MKVVMNSHAITNMVMSAVEVYKKETYGLLLGKKIGKDLRIHNALSFQTAKRHYEWVDTTKIRKNRVHETAPLISGMNIIGDFHSHPDEPEKLSSQDVKELKEFGNISVLVLVKKSNSKKMWKYESEKRRICGNLAGKYFVSITAYQYIDGKAERLPIKCTHLGDINKSARIYDYGMWGGFKLKRKKKR